MDIGSIFGPLVIGALLNLILYGFMFMQCYIYVTTYQTDSLWLKAFVLYLFIADTVDTAFTAAIIYDYLVTHFGELNYLARATWIFCTDPALTGIISCSVQLFFAYRVKRLTGYSWAALLICCLAISSCCGALGSAIAVNWWHEFSQFQEFKVVVIIWLVCAVTADIVITSILVTYLRQKRSGYGAADDIIDRIVRMTVQTGLITAVVALIDAILFLASTSSMHILFNFPLSKLYTNSLMSNLNARGGWERGSSRSRSATAPESRNRPSVTINRHISQPNQVRFSKDGASDDPRYYFMVQTHGMKDNHDRWVRVTGTQDGHGILSNRTFASLLSRSTNSHDTTGQYILLLHEASSLRPCLLLGSPSLPPNLCLVAAMKEIGEFDQDINPGDPLGVVGRNVRSSIVRVQSPRSYRQAPSTPYGTRIFLGANLALAEANLKVMLSVGAVQTPRLLFSSSGDRDQLNKFDIATIVHNKAVRQNLHDLYTANLTILSTTYLMPSYTGALPADGLEKSVDIQDEDLDSILTGGFFLDVCAHSANYFSLFTNVVSHKSHLFDTRHFHRAADRQGGVEAQGGGGLQRVRLYFPQRFRHGWKSGGVLNPDLVQ
ncbi:hypothetical protein OF83DRAFT_1172940 [Amylostereum chailletii]|nr:hypothetical protein OF83DRAFT_1172940 [Amylostereum chailletii]